MVYRVILASQAIPEFQDTVVQEYLVTLDSQEFLVTLDFPVYLDIAVLEFQVTAVQEFLDILACPDIQE